jgi:hypothetical protein
MKNAVITAKLPSGKWECVYIGENITEAKIEYKRLDAAERTEDGKGYLQFNLFFQPQMRRISKSGRQSEAELKEIAKVKRQKAKSIEKAQEAEEIAFQKELEAEEKELAKEAKAVKKRQTVEKAAKAKARAEDAKMVEAKEAAKQEAFAQVVADKMKAKK